MSLVLLSGGLDSAVLLVDMIKNPFRYYDEPINALFLDFGTQAHKTCKKSLESFNKQYHGAYNFITYDTSKMIHPKIPVYDPNYRKRDTFGDTQSFNMFTPFRILYMYVVAAVYAANLGDSRIYVGNHRRDGGDIDDTGEHYWDCDVRLINEVNRTLDKASNDLAAPIILAPFAQYSKLDIVRLGKSLNVPFELTYSCGFGPKRCMSCTTCTTLNAVFVDVLGRLPEWRFNG